MTPYHKAPSAQGSARPEHRLPPRLPAPVLLSLAAVVAILFLPSPAHAGKTVRQFLADGFDYPVGKPDGFGYYKARGFWPNGHLGEDWNGRGGGNSDLGDPVYAIGHGVVVFSADYRKGWGNVVIIRHAYRENDGRVTYADSLYGHLDKRLVNLHDRVKRGHQIGTIGTNRGMYLAHLHFELRKNLNIGMNRTDFGRDYANYHRPTDFIKRQRKLRTGFRLISIPVDTFKGQGDSIRLTQSQTVIPIGATRRSSKQTAARRAPEDVEKVLEGYELEKQSSTKSFWQKIKERLRFFKGRNKRDPRSEEG